MPFTPDKFKLSEKSVVHEIQKPLGCLRILSELCGLRLFVLFLMAAEVNVC
jgi:hypothetical protein